MLTFTYLTGELEPFHVTEELVRLAGMERILEVEEDRHPAGTRFFWDFKHDRYRHSYRVSGRWARVNMSLKAMFDRKT